MDVALDERHSHHEDHSAATPQPKLGLSPAKTQRRKGRKGRKITVKNLLQNNSSLPSELGVLCALAGVNSLCSNISDTRKFAPAAQTFEHSNTKATKGSDIFDHKLRALRMLSESLRGWRKLSGIWNIRTQGIDSRQGAKHAKFGGKR